MAIDLKTALINEMFENSRSKTTFKALMHKITQPSSLHLRSPTPVQLDLFKKGTKPGDPPQNVDKSIRILSKDQILVSCSHMTCYLQNLHYISINILY